MDFQRLLPISRSIDRVIEGIGRISYWLVLVMVILGVWNVVGRYVGKFVGQNVTSNSLIEAQWYLFDLVFLFGAAYGLKHNEHVRVDLIYRQLSPRKQAWINLLGGVLFLIPFACLVIYFSWETVLNSWRSWEISPDPGGLPRYPIKTAILLGFGLLILQGISEIIKNAAFLFGGNQSEDGADV
ncbi:MAG: TRAP transporter small permease subunit [Cyanobacteria bacterium P01_H01_bin.15]